MDTQQQQQGLGNIGPQIRPTGPGPMPPRPQVQSGVMPNNMMGMTNTSQQQQQDNSMLRNTLQQPAGTPGNRPPMSMPNNSMAGQMQQQQVQQQQPQPGGVGGPQQQPGGGQSQLANLLKKAPHDLDPNDLARATEMRNKVPTVDSHASSIPNSMAGGPAVMTQANTTSQNQLMSTANTNMIQQQQHMSMANNGPSGVVMNGPTSGGPIGTPTMKTEQPDKMEVKTEIKNEPEIKSEPMDIPSANGQPGSHLQQDLKVKMETNDTKPEIKDEPGTGGSGNAGGPIKTEPVKSEPVASDTKPATTTAAAPAVKAEVKKVQFTTEQLRDALLPPLEKMYAQEPEAGPFRTPVDPNALGIPDYFEIIRTPMDMSSIRRKLETGGYKVRLSF